MEFPTAAARVIIEYLTGVGSHSTWEVIAAAFTIGQWLFQELGQQDVQLAAVQPATEEQLVAFLQAKVDCDTSVSAAAAPSLELLKVVARIICQLVG